MESKTDHPEKTIVDNNAPSCYSISNAGNAKSALVRTVAQAVAPAPKPSASPAADIRKECVCDMAKPDILNLYRIWRETDRRLDSLAQSVREGVQVSEASNFARWLRFSGILTFLQPFEQEVPLPIRASELTRKCEDLIYECGQWFALHERSYKPRDAYISESKLAAIEDDLRAIKEALSLPSMATASAVDTAEAALRVLPGGF